MKKIFSLFMAICLVLSVSPIIAFGDSEIPTITTVKIKNATLDLKVGEKPVFTAESAEPELYSTRLDTFERWMDVETGAYITSSDFYNSRIEAFGDTRIDEFIAGHTYAYSISVQAIDKNYDNNFSCRFTEDTNIIINGAYYEVPVENKSFNDFDGINYSVFFNNVFTVTVPSVTTVDVRIGKKTFTNITGDQTIIVDSLDLSDITILKQNGMDVEGASDEWSMSTKYLDSQNRGVLEVQTSKKTSDSVTFNLVSHYEDCPGADFENFQIMFITAHMHKYVNKVTKATLTKNGKIVPTCSCGLTKSATAIAYPKTITLSAASYVYDGKVKAPKVTVKDSKGKAIAASNYTVTYASGRKNVGKYAVKITFKGNYSGTKTLYFTIVPKGTTIASLTAGSKAMTVKWKKQATQTTGYQIQYSTDANFKKGNKTVNIGSSKTVSKKITKLTGKKKYYVRVRTYKKVGSTTYYSAWSAKKNVTVKK